MLSEKTVINRRVNKSKLPQTRTIETKSVVDKITKTASSDSNIVDIPFDGIIIFGDLNYRLDCPRLEVLLFIYYF